MAEQRAPSKVSVAAGLTGGAVFRQLRRVRCRRLDGHAGANHGSRKGQAGSQLPPVQVTAPEAKRRASTAPAQRADRAGPRRRSQAARQTEPQAAPKSFRSVAGRAYRHAGVYANSTSIATKTNTPLVNIPQSVTVVTKDFIRDQSFQSLTDVTRYVPGVAIHQGEGNRDELVIRGVDSSANFFVNGFRDDVQYFRDLYNAQSIEILKGPSALIFGRGAGGGLVNRTLKEADGTRVYEADRADRLLRRQARWPRRRPGRQRKRRGAFERLLREQRYVPPVWPLSNAMASTRRSR